MKIAVLGGGTAGFIAAAHISNKLPNAELLHIFDSRIPTIGVGEGTTPRFPLWLQEIAGLDFSDLQERCGATLKKGTRFDGWGSDGSEFLNRFQPAQFIGYHIDASEVVKVIAEHVQAQQLDQRVDHLVSSDSGVDIQFENGTDIRCDYVFDARGFPRAELSDADRAHSFVKLDWVPTNRALLRWLAPGEMTTLSRAVARPYGWIFQIPLRDRTTCGYVFNSSISSDTEVEDDFAAFLHKEGVHHWESRGGLDFPNFLRRAMFDGRVFYIGNAASFLEPLEATAIGTGIVQVRMATDLISEHGANGVKPKNAVDEFNKTMSSYISRNSLFVAWHYSCGSIWDSDFWRLARQRLSSARQSTLAQSHLVEFDKYIEAGRQIPNGALQACEDQDQWNREIFPLMKQYLPFGNFSELNFAQVGRGIGYYNTYPDTSMGEMG